MVAAVQNKIAMIFCFSSPTVHVHLVSDVVEFHSLNGNTIIKFDAKSVLQDFSL